MSIINWQQFGLKKNPYDTLPLIEGGDLPIDKAFVGRIKERDFLNSLFESESRLCLTICGEVGVGKTSLANHHKFTWKYYQSKKPLFSFRREIEASSELLNKKNFLIEIIGSVIREIKLLDPKLLEGNELLKKLNYIVDISQNMAFSFGGSAYGFGIDFSKDSGVIQPIQLSVTSLEDYFMQLLGFIQSKEIRKKYYKGLIVHVNNFDVVLNNDDSKQRVIKFFNEIRDILQTPNVYFIFLGPKNLFKDIISVEKRVKSIFFQTPLMLNPLSKTEIIQAFDERMKLLKSEDVVDYIKPFEDEVIFRLYDIYQGDIRSIMASLRDILNQYSDKLAKNLSVDEAMILLGRELWDRIEKLAQLTDEQKTVLSFIAQFNKDITQKDIVQIFGRVQSNVSGYYFKPLKDAGIIEEKKQEGKIKYWGLTQDYTPLKYSLESQNKIREKIDKNNKQLSLLD